MNRNAFFGTAAIAAVFASTPALAQSAPPTSAIGATASRSLAPARSYVDRSLSLLGSAGLNSYVALDSEYTASWLRVDGELRWISRGWMIAPRLGVSGGITTVRNATGPDSALNASIAPGVAFGLLRPLADNITLGVAVSYRFEAGGLVFSSMKSTRLAHIGAIEAPLTVFVSPNAFVEPTLSLAITHERQRAERNMASGELVRTSVSGAVALRAGYRF